MIGEVEIGTLIHFLWISTLENSLIEIKHTLIIWPNNSAPRHLPKRNENTCPQKDSHMNVHPTQMCINRQIDKQMVEIDTTNYLFSNEKETRKDTYHNMNQTHAAKFWNKLSKHTRWQKSDQRLPVERVGVGTGEKVHRNLGKWRKHSVSWLQWCLLE